MSIRTRVAFGTARNAPGTTALLLAITAVFAFGTFFLLGGSQQYLDAVKSGAASTFGNYTYQFSGGYNASQTIFRTETKTGALTAFITAHGVIRSASGARATAGTVRELSGPSRFGRLTHGRFPTAPGEVSISAAAERQLGAAVGATVTVEAPDADLGHQPYTVTGITVNSADRDEVTLTAVSRSTDVAERAQTWAGDTNPADTNDAMNTDVQSGNLSVVTRGQVENRARHDAQSRVLGALHPIEIFTFVLAGAALIGVLSVVASRLRPVRDALEGAGLSARGALLTATGILLTLPLLGGALGIAAAAVTLVAARPAIGRRLGQDWEAIGANPTATFLGAAFVLGYTLIAIAVTLALAARRHRQESAQVVAVSGRSRRWICLTAGVGVVAALALIGARLTHVMIHGHLLGLGLLALALPVFVVYLPWLRSTPIQQRAALPMSPVSISLGHLTPFVASALLCAISGLVSAGLMADVHAQGTLDPHVGFLDAQPLTSKDVVYLRSAYPVVMRQAVVLRWADDAPQEPRATTWNGFSCFRTAAGSARDSECESDLQTIAFAPRSGPGSDLAGTVSSQLVPSATTVPLVFFKPASARVAKTGKIAVAHHSSAIGGNVLPGLILPTDSTSAATLGIVASRQHVEVYIPNFATLPDKTRNDFRSDILTRSSSANITESNSTDRSQQTTTAFTYGAFAALACAAVATLSALMLAAHQRPLREAIGLFAPTSWQRIRLVLPHVTAWIVTVTAPSLLGAASAASSYTAFTGPHAFAPGWFWLIPVPAVAITMVATLVITARRRP